MKERLKNNIEILKRHNLTHEPVFHITDGKKHEIDLINEIVEDCEKIFNDEEQGLIVRLPIPFGTELYFLHSHQHADKPYPPTIHKTNKWTFEIWGNGKSGISCDDLPCGYYGTYHHELGKTVFLTRTEAEKKLKELRGGV